MTEKPKLDDKTRIEYEHGFHEGYSRGFDDGKQQGKQELKNEFFEVVEKYCMDGDEMLEWMKHGSLLKSKWLKSQLKKDEVK